MTRPVPVGTEHHAEILRRLSSSERLSSIGAEYGMSARRLRRMARGAGIPSRFLSAEQRDELLARRAGGERASSLATSYGVTVRRVQQLCHDASIPSHRRDNATGEVS